MQRQLEPGGDDGAAAGPVAEAPSAAPLVWEIANTPRGDGPPPRLPVPRPRPASGGGARRSPSPPRARASTPPPRRPSPPARRSQPASGDAPGSSSAHRPPAPGPAAPAPSGTPAAKPGAALGAAAADAVGSGKDTRQMFDKRTLRRDNAESFAEAIAAWREQQPPARAAELAAADAAERGAGAGVPRARRAAQGRHWLRVFVRKRPLFEHERERGEFDVISVPRTAGPAPAEPAEAGAPPVPPRAAPPGRGVPRAPRALTVHHCLHEADLRRMYVRHVSFRASAVFDEGSTNEQVYALAARELVSRVCSGGVSTLFSFGQTGSGKTHTCNAIEQHAAHQLFNEVELGRAGGGRVLGVHVSYIELAGRSITDLLASAEQPGAGGAEGAGGVSLLDDRDGRTLIVGAAYRTVRSAAELLAAIKVGRSRRATEATAVNAVSSRSHAVVRIVVERAEDEDEGEGGGGSGAADGGADGGDGAAPAAADAAAGRPRPPAARDARKPPPARFGAARGPAATAAARRSPQRPRPTSAAARAASPAQPARTPGRRKSAPLSGVAPSRHRNALPRVRDGQLVLVDCAGTERKEDSALHTAERRREGAEINASLHALRECLRAIAAAEDGAEGRRASLGGGRARTPPRGAARSATPPRRGGDTRAVRARTPERARAGSGGGLRFYPRAPSPAAGGGGVLGVHVPYRGSVLTRVLADSFTHARAAVCVLATVSPGSSDAEHSLHTLQTVTAMCALDGQTTEAKEEVGASGAGLPPPPPAHPSQWTPDELREWLETVAAGRFARHAASLPSSLDGKILTRMPAAHFSFRLCGGDKRAGDAVFRALKAEIERVNELKAAYQEQMRDQRHARGRA